MATMAVSALGRDWATACCKSLVKVAMPQRRGSELPMKASRMDWVTLKPPAVVGERSVGYENAQRSAGMAVGNSARHAAYRNYPWKRAGTNKLRGQARERHFIEYLGSSNTP